MKELVQAFEERLRGLFEKRAAEMTQFAQEEPTRAEVAMQLHGLYQELLEVLAH